MNKLKITDKGLRVLYTLQDPILCGHCGKQLERHWVYYKAGVTYCFRCQAYDCGQLAMDEDVIYKIDEVVLTDSFD